MQAWAEATDTQLTPADVTGGRDVRAGHVGSGTEDSDVEAALEDAEWAAIQVWTASGKQQFPRICLGQALRLPVDAVGDINDTVGRTDRDLRTFPFIRPAWFAQAEAEARVMSRRTEQRLKEAAAVAEDVSHLCACIGSLCLRQCVHGASIGPRGCVR
eukprot:COSAG01_NODE_4428_length_5032_cov_11.671666_8_plen_158_part_00